jgi:hypothetical protein
VLKKLIKLKGSDLFRFNYDNVFSKLLRVNCTNFLGFCKNLTNEEYKDFVYKTLTELIINFKWLRDCNNLKYSLIEIQEYSIIYNELIDDLLLQLNEKINRIKKWQENKINEENERKTMNEEHENRITIQKSLKEMDLNEHITYLRNNGCIDSNERIIRNRLFRRTS